MRQPIDKVEIKEPPLQELNKKRSCLKRSCFTGCGCIIIFLVGSILLIRFATTPRIRELKHVPDQVETAVPLYDPDSLGRITLTQGKERGRVIERIALIPKVLLSPLLLTLERHSQPTPTATTSQSEADFDWNQLRQLINEPIADHRDLVQMEWRDLPAAPGFIASYYHTELKKHGFEVTPTAETKKIHQLSFVKDEIGGAVYVRSATGATEDANVGTEYVRVTVNIQLE